MGKLQKTWKENTENRLQTLKFRPIPAKAKDSVLSASVAMEPLATEPVKEEDKTNATQGEDDKVSYHSFKDDDDDNILFKPKENKKKEPKKELDLDEIENYIDH